MNGRHAVFAVGYLTVTPEQYVANPRSDAFRIVGSGFLIRPLVGITCAHVLTKLAEMTRKARPPRKYQPVLQLVYPSNRGWETVSRSFGVLSSDEKTDLAFLQLRGEPSPVQPVRLVDQTYVPEVGQNIGLCSYAHGEMLLTHRKEIDRYGPVVQRGIIAAISPYDSGPADAVLLDLIAGPAASGSPVFLHPIGDVIGVLTEGQVGKTAALSRAKLVHRNNGEVRTGVGKTFEILEATVKPTGGI